MRTIGLSRHPVQGLPTLLAVKMKSRSVVRTSWTPGFSTLITTSLLLPRSTAACTCSSSRHQLRRRAGPRAMLAVSAPRQHCGKKCGTSSTQPIGKTATAMLAAHTSLLGGALGRCKLGWHLPCNALACAFQCLAPQVTKLLLSRLHGLKHLWGSVK